MTVRTPREGSGSEAQAPLQVATGVGVIVERRPSDNRWIDETWVPVGVIPAYPATEPWQLMREADGISTYLARVVSLTLHRAEVEAYKLNLSEPVPKVFIVMMPAESGSFPYQVELATCAPYEAEGYLMNGEEIVEPVPMPAEIAAWMQGFIDSHRETETFIKRKRDTASALVEHQFGKDPIFEKPGRYTTGEGDDG